MMGLFLFTLGLIFLFVGLVGVDNRARKYLAPVPVPIYRPVVSHSDSVVSHYDSVVYSIEKIGHSALATTPVSPLKTKFIEVDRATFIKHINLCGLPYVKHGYTVDTYYWDQKVIGYHKHSGDSTYHIMVGRR